MAMSSEPIWILDSEMSCVALYHQTLGLHHELRTFSGFAEFAQALAQNVIENPPRLLIADPESAKGKLADFFAASAPKGKIPDVLIASKIDDVDLMRFFLRLGARDYILKPLRPNELVVKVERALQGITSRQVQILRNDLDGKSIGDLTFREHQILTVLLMRPARSASREELLEMIWNRASVNRKTLDVHLFNLRRKLRPHGYDILSVNTGFRLVKMQDPATQS